MADEADQSNVHRILALPRIPRWLTPAIETGQAKTLPFPTVIQERSEDPPTNGTARTVWTDSSGTPWDLSKTYRDADGHLWWWTGAYDQNVPLMRAATAAVDEPLDVVDLVHGPLNAQQPREAS